MSNLVEVVSGITTWEGRILLTQRRAEKDFPFQWECPGGKVDAGESLHEALRREWREELGVGVCDIVSTPVWSGDFQSVMKRSDRAHIRLTFFRVISMAGMPHPKEGQGLGWFTEAEMGGLALAPGNERAFEPIAEAAFHVG